jgi:hypothetical protein
VPEFRIIKFNKMFKCLTPVDQSHHPVKAANPTLQGGGLNLIVHPPKGFSPDYERVYSCKVALRPLKEVFLIAILPSLKAGVGSLLCNLEYFSNHNMIFFTCKTSVKYK